jgi:hypothetical protein
VKQELLRTELTLAGAKEKQLEKLDFDDFLREEKKLVAGDLHFDYDKTVHTVAV